MAWVLITICATLFQTIRTALQKHLKTHLSTDAVNWVRYGFAFPFVCMYLLLLVGMGASWPQISGLFLIYCLVAALFQIIGTDLLISLFTQRNFAVGTTYAKTETLQAALMAWVLFDETLSLSGIIAIIMGVVGISLMACLEGKLTFSHLLRSMLSKTALMGIGSGAAFSITSIAIRQATLTLEHDYLMGAAFTLWVVISIQTLLMGWWIFYRDRASFSKMFHHWKTCLAVGITSTFGSIGWFTAFALTHVAYVKTVGQIELLFSLLITQHIFKERISLLEVIGMMLVVGSIIVLVSAI